MQRAAGLIAALAIAAIPVAGCGGGGTSAGTSTTTAMTAAATVTTTSGSTKGTHVSASTCTTITTSTTEGPYYVTGTAALVDGNLNMDDLPGETIRIAGYVYSGADKSTPLANARVDVWQADSSGRYWPQSNGPASGYTDQELSLRGHVVTDASGYYEFTTIYPGEYEGRARHIHVRATSSDGTQDVITQLIMSKSGDSTPASSDAIAQSLPDCNTMRFTTVDGTPTAYFDFHLAPA